MISENKKECLVTGEWYIEIGCLHGDTKPTGNYATGSLALEVDTGDVYAYNAYAGEWAKVCELGGSGS